VRKHAFEYGSELYVWGFGVNGLGGPISSPIQEERKDSVVRK
jgi:hypothetical protein